MIYKRFPLSEANSIMRKCLDRGIEYHVWNIEDIWVKNCEYIEIGLHGEDWNKLDICETCGQRDVLCVCSHDDL